MESRDSILFFTEAECALASKILRPELHHECAPIIGVLLVDYSKKLQALTEALVASELHMPAPYADVLDLGALRVFSLAVEVGAIYFRNDPNV